MSETAVPPAAIGLSTPSTTEVLLDRLAQGSRPRARTDDHRVALVIEGGGMRGVVSGGMVLALEQLGLRDAFDVVVGTSAGAIMGAFFVTGRSTNASALYYTDLVSEPFLNKRRLLKFQAAMDIDYLIDEALVERGLDGEAISASPIPVYATLTPAEETNHKNLMRLDGGDERVRAILRSTASLPVLAGPSKHIDGEPYVDGGLLEQVPWRSALDLGASHVLVVPSRPVVADEERSPMSFVERVTVLRVIRAMHGAHVAELTRTLPARASYQASALRTVADGTGVALTSALKPWTGAMEIIELNDDVELPDRLESERPVLVDAMANGAQAVLDHFQMGTISVEPRIVLDHPVARVGLYRSKVLSEILTDARQRIPAPDGPVTTTA